MLCYEYVDRCTVVEQLCYVTNTWIAVPLLKNYVMLRICGSLYRKFVEQLCYVTNMWIAVPLLNNYVNMWIAVPYIC